MKNNIIPNENNENFNLVSVEDFDLILNSLINDESE
jgi:hypothetical protein